MKIKIIKQVCTYLLCAFFWLPQLLHAQSFYIDSLKKSLFILPENKQKVEILQQLSFNYAVSWADSSILYAKKGIQLADKLNLPLNKIDLLQSMSLALGEKGNFSLSLANAFDALSLAKEIGDEDVISNCKAFIGISYFYAEDYKNALTYLLDAKNNTVLFYRDKAILPGILGETYYQLGELDSAQFYIQQALDFVNEDHGHWAVPYLYMGKLAEQKNQFDEALSYYKKSISKDVAHADYIKGFLAIAGIFNQLNNPDSSIYYAKLAHRISNNSSLFSYSYQASELLKSVYKENNQIDSAFKYQELMMVEKDSLFNRDKLNQFQNIAYEDEKRNEKLRIEKERFLNKIKLYSLLIGLLVIISIVLILVRNNKFRQRAYNLLQKQKTDLDKQKSKVEQALSELKSTQSQLIQSEKMASLGELTAGIAHEIQNPLNFVNNFSEVNSELIDEADQEIDKGNISEVKTILQDIKENEKKINHHGKRADAIVKGMLQHSRTSSGVKEQTDINALADEYLRLSYHGLKAKDKSFNADFKTEFDPNLPKINVIPQDIGRVLLNLINNAFYAVQVKTQNSASLQQTPQKQPDYNPMVMVSTKNMGTQIEIRVKDNGPGIPSEIKDKIFQPFFTTKPTGQGTGLGLSLAYDIVKAHGGEITVKSEEREGTEFIILIPINSKS